MVYKIPILMKNKQQRRHPASGIYAAPQQSVRLQGVKISGFFQSARQGVRHGRIYAPLLFCIQMKIDPVNLSHPSAPPATEPVQSEAVDRRTLPATIADRLREMIIEGELAAGTRLNERALCDRLQVSRTPLREAFRLLSADGLVRLQPTRGAHVGALSEKDIRESFEVLGALEASYGQLACQRNPGQKTPEIQPLTFD